MWKIYQDKTVANDGQGNCMNACVASILEITLRNTPNILPRCEGSWLNQWRVWLADKGYRLAFRSHIDPPSGYSIATVYTERMYPKGHAKEGLRIAHACVAFDGVVIHDPYPLPTEQYEVKYYNELKPLTEVEKKNHETMLSAGRCIHGYRVSCTECSPL